MKVHYKRDLNSNYMIVSGDILTENNYELRMITENRIHGCLPCVVQCQGEHNEYFYEITGKQSMALLYERKKLSFQRLQEFLQELLRIFQASEEYLLKADHFILEPEYIYLHTQSEKPTLCYYPSYEKDVRESFLCLAEYLLGKIDKSDMAAVEFGYELYQNAMEENFSLSEILAGKKEEPQIFTMETEPRLVDSLSIAESGEPLREKSSVWKNLFKRKGKKPQLEDYVAEADRMGGGSVLFLREQQNQMETMFLREEKKEGLLLKSLEPEYPSFHVRETPFLIGKRQEQVDGCVPTPTISRIHARITKDAEMYFLEDLNSTNGTWVEQQQLNPYERFPIKSGTLIRFAGAEYIVEL